MFFLIILPLPNKCFVFKKTVLLFGGIFPFVKTGYKRHRLLYELYRNDTVNGRHIRKYAFRYNSTIHPY